MQLRKPFQESRSRLWQRPPDPPQNFIAFDAAIRSILWHYPIGATHSDTPETYMLDGHQYSFVASKDTLYAFYLQ